MIIYKNDYYKNRTIPVSYVLFLDDSGMLVKMGPDVKELLGIYEVLPFCEIGFSESDKEELVTFLNNLKENTANRTILNINDCENRHRLMDIRGKYTADASLPYEIIMWDLENIEEEFDYFKDHTWKYRVMLGMTGLTFFDYDVDENIISFYHYVARKSAREFYGSFETFTEEFMKDADPDENNLASARSFVEQIRECRNTVEAIVHGTFLSSGNKSRTLHFRVQFDGMFCHNRMYGIVTNISDSEDDVPFYKTTSGFDSLTGLLNKRSLIEYTEDILATPATASRKHYMIILDIDDFKNINDNYGHQKGDEAILMLAHTLVDVVEDKGIIGRFGGDEFYVLTESIADENELRALTRMIRSNVEIRGKEELGIEGIHVSMGISSFPEDGMTYNDLMAIADKCLYIAKEKGKNRYIIYRPALHANIKVGVESSGISSYDEQAKVMNKTVIELFSEGKPAILKNLPLIVKGFDLDSIDIFYGSGLSERHSEGKYSSGIDAAFFMDNKKYMSGFDSNGVFVLNNYNNFRRQLPEVFKYLTEKKCMAMIQMVYPSVDDPKVFISFNMLNRIHKWSDSEISHLVLFGMLIGKFAE